MNNKYNAATSGEVVLVSEYMTTTVVTANENQSVRDVCKLMYNKKIGSVVILENAKGSETNSDKNNRALGIVTERDYVRLIGFSEMFLVDIPVSEIMSRPLITIGKDTSITEAISVMQAKNIRRLPVLDNNGKMTGIITDKDILKAIMTNQSLATSLLNEPTLLVDQHSFFGRYTSNSWLRDIYPN